MKLYLLLPKDIYGTQGHFKRQTCLSSYSMQTGAIVTSTNMSEISEIMMTSPNGNIFRVTGSLCGELNSPHKGQWRGALMLSMICVWINGWVNNHEAGDLRRYRTYYNVTVMIITLLIIELCTTNYLFYTTLRELIIVSVHGLLSVIHNQIIGRLLRLWACFPFANKRFWILQSMVFLLTYDFIDWRV